MTETLTLSGGNGLRLNAVATGPEGAPPILFVHGLIASHLAWVRQFDSDLAGTYRLVAIDQRGHGLSEKPEGFEPYRDARLWAEDLAAAIAACGRPPIVVVWSYGGLVLGNYLHHFGDEGIAGIVHCSAIVAQGVGSPPPTPETQTPFLSQDLGTSIAGTIGLAQVLTAGELTREDLAWMVAQAAATPPNARLGCLMRSEDVAPDYARVTKPAIVITAEEDALVKRAEAEDAMAAMPHATLLSYPGCGHMPFWEDAGRFNADLGAFAAETFGAAA